MVVVVMGLVAGMIFIAVGYFLLQSISRQHLAEWKAEVAKEKAEREADKVLYYEFRKTKIPDVCHDKKCKARGSSNHKCHNLDCAEHHSV